ncbi:secretion system protein [Methanoculleus sp. FWC-SCC1]|uniref:Secretion system protein n=1 Tax=Methanoculleus frigidifontis TaxID=2584085 RepID=A0ABT8M9S8_9EURY|nr:type II secretion system F family protein [Methanoculleus sp. FWC-SCC1]MDN7024688.1 secretion system protein [Methanoculleus sp. FWC-SCC1]
MTFRPAAQARQGIHWWVTRDPIKYRSLREDMIAARIGMTLDHYILRSILISALAGALWAVLGYLAANLFLTPLLSVRIYNVFNVQVPSIIPADLSFGLLRAVAALVIFLVVSSLVYVFLLKYPSFQKSSRATKINLLLHNAVSYMYAMRRGGTHLMVIFRSVAENSSIYGEVSNEFRQIVRDTDYFGYDMISAIKHLHETTPSDKMRDFLQDMISVIDSGGDVLTFLAARVRTYQEEARFEQKTFLNTLQLAAEGYVTLFVAGPLFIIIIMVVMGFMGTAPIMELSVVTYMLIPLGSLVFILFIDMISIKSENVERYIGTKWLHEYSDVRTEKREGEEPLFAQLERYDRWRKVREFFRHPLQTFLIEPSRTFYVTVPIALVYVGLTLLSIPQYADIEVLIDVIDDHIVFGILMILLPFGVFYQLWRSKVMSIEAGIPDFLDRLSGINQVGLTLAQAITILVRANLGVLTYEIKRIKRDIEWGANINEALVRFEERVRTASIARTVTLITKASQMTGDIGEVLNIAARDAEMSEVLKRERMAEMFIYTVIVYLVFFVFLFVVVVIDSQFLSALAEINTEGLKGVGGAIQMGNTPIMTFERLLYHTCLLQAFFSGLIAGEMGEASLRAGVKHAAVLILIAVVVFTIFL